MNAPEPSAEQSTPKRQRSISRPRRARFVLLVLAVLGAGLCALLALNTATAASEVAERRLDASNSSLTDSAQQLSRDIAGAQAPDNLARMAAALGLVPADSPAFLRINADGSATVLGKAARVPAPVNPAALAARKKAAAVQRLADAARAAAKRKDDLAQAAATKRADAAKRKTSSATKTPTSTPTSKPTSTSTSEPTSTSTTTPTATPTRSGERRTSSPTKPTVTSTRTTTQPTTALLPGGQR